MSRPHARRPALLGAVLFIACSTTLDPAAAWAQSAPTTAPATAPALADEMQGKFVAAREQYEKLDYAKALPLFRELLAATHSPNARLYMARCLRELGDLPAAYEELRVTLGEATDLARTEPRYQPTRDAAGTELVALEKHVARVSIVLRSNPPGSRVTLNDKPVPGARLGDVSRGVLSAQLPILPGELTIEVTAPGKTPWKRTMRIEAGPTVLIEVPELAAPTSAPPAGPRGGVQRTAGIALGAVGVAGVVVGSIFGLGALSKKSDGDKLCDGKLCSQSGLDLHDDSLRSANVSNVAFAAGAACLIAGGVVFFTAPSGSLGRPSTAIRFSPAGSGGLLTVEGVF